MRHEIKSPQMMNGISLDNGFAKDSPISQVKMSKTNLYIKGLPSTFNDEDIVNLAPNKLTIRSVKAAIEDDKRCKGYGFIDFLTPEDAQLGLTFIQEKNPNYTIKFAKENEKDKTNLYVTNLPKSWTSRDSDKLKGLFEKYGEIQSAFIMLEKYANKPLGVGFVRFFNEESAHLAITNLETNPLHVSDECVGPLEAKYADKHGSDSRRKYPVNKVGLNGKLQSSNQLPLLTNPNSAQLLTALFDNNYVKSQYPSAMASSVNDAYSQYMLNVAQYGMLDPYCFIPTVIAPSSSNYYSAYNNTTSHPGNFYPNMFYALHPSNIQGDQIASSNMSYVTTNPAQNPVMTNNFNRIL